MNPPMRYKTKALDSGSGFQRDKPRKSKSPPKKKSPTPDKQEKQPAPKAPLKPAIQRPTKTEVPYIPAPVAAPPQISIAQLRQQISRAKTDVQDLFADTQELNVGTLVTTDLARRKAREETTQTPRRRCRGTPIVGRPPPTAELCRVRPEKRSSQVFGR